MGYKYKIDHDYFNEIDNEYKAYILGFIFADGSVHQPKGNRQLNLTIAIQEEDGYILKKLSEEACGGNFSILNPPSTIRNGCKRKACVKLVSNRIGKRLISYGCKINKSRLGMDFPEIREDLIHHFIRGFLDGDGSILVKKLGYKYKRKTTWKMSNAHRQQYKMKIAFCSTNKVFLEKLFSFLPAKKIYIPGRMRKQMVYILWIENAEDVKNCIEYLYKDANYFLKRKHDKIEEFNMTIKSQAEDTSSEGLTTT